MKEKTGGPAFPGVAEGVNNFSAGMTLRDYFAAKAMQGLLISCPGMPNKTMTKQSYKFADDMIEERDEN